MATTIKLPELGENVDSGDLVRILVSPGDTISRDQPLLELETEKATIEVPSPVSGVVKELHVQEGRKVKVGDPLFTIEENGAGTKPPAATRQPAPEKMGPKPQPGKEQPGTKQPEPQRPESTPTLRTEPQTEVQPEPPAGEQAQGSAEEENEETVIPFRAEPAEQRRPLAPASPSIRRLARELGIDVYKVSGTGPEGHITEQDLKNYAREVISRPAARAPDVGFTEMPDFAKWGAIERKPMTNVRRATAEHLARAWHNVPQVTQFDTADVSELENLRTGLSAGRDTQSPKITVTVVALKVVAAALEKFPQFAASMDMPNREIIYKHYVNIGVAVDTSYGLVVPVIRDANRKTIPQLASELTELSEKAREKKLSNADMAGGVFTITNLGGIGGMAFSPIVNYPEVAILGMSRITIEPRYIGGAFQPRKILPISLSYDHRLIDGADAARFLRWVAEALEQPVLLLFRA